jgi:hypothetical protein
MMLTDEELIEPRIELDPDRPYLARCASRIQKLTSGP